MKIISFILCLTISNFLIAQDSTSKNSSLNFNGYLKLVETIQFDDLNNTSISGHLLHNRLNLKWKATNNTYFVGELRNRFIYGEAGSENQKPVFKSEIERLYTNIQANNWDFRIGRQRVNWGISTIWNPNDIFNAYNFLDVDYEERPGVDAIKAQYNYSSFSNFEFVHSGFGKNQITAAKYFINKSGYDIQIIAGDYKGDLTIGAGWAGNIKEAGFKGEAQHFFNREKIFEQTNITFGLDYMFKNGWYMNAGFLYNSLGLDNKIVGNQNLNFQLSAKNLMPTKHNMLVMLEKEINPLSSFGLSIIYAPRVDLLLLMPSLKFNIAQNIDADIIWQSFFLNRGDQFKSLQNIGFFRLRFSFKKNSY